MCCHAFKPDRLPLQITVSSPWQFHSIIPCLKRETNVRRSTLVSKTEILNKNQGLNLRLYRSSTKENARSLNSFGTMRSLFDPLHVYGWDALRKHPTNLTASWAPSVITWMDYMQRSISLYVCTLYTWQIRLIWLKCHMFHVSN